MAAWAAAPLKAALIQRLRPHQHERSGRGRGDPFVSSLGCGARRRPMVLTMLASAARSPVGGTPTWAGRVIAWNFG